MLFIPDFYSLFHENIHLGSNQSLRHTLCCSSRYQDRIPEVKKIWSMIGRILLRLWKNLNEARR